MRSVTFRSATVALYRAEGISAVLAVFVRVSHDDSNIPANAVITKYLRMMSTFYFPSRPFNSPPVPFFVLSFYNPRNTGFTHTESLREWKLVNFAGRPETVIDLTFLKKT